MIMTDFGFGELPAPVPVALIEVGEPESFGHDAQPLDFTLPTIDAGVDADLQLLTPVALFVGERLQALNQAADLAAGLVGQTVDERKQIPRFLERERTLPVDLDDAVQVPSEELLVVEVSEGLKIKKR